MIQQRHEAKETGIPREGCFFYALLVAPFHYAGLFPDRPDANDARRIYADCLVEKRWSVKGLVPIIQVRKRPDGIPGLNVNSPDGVLEIAQSYTDLARRRLRQFPDKVMDYFLEDEPWSYDVVYTVWEWKRRSDTNHWALMDCNGIDLVYNPDVVIPLPADGRTGKWRPISVT